PGIDKRFMGSIWRRPGQLGATVDDAREYWLTEGAPGKLLGAGRIAIPPALLALSTNGARRNIQQALLPSPLERRRFARDVCLSRARALAGVSGDNLKSSQQLGSLAITSLKVRRSPGDMP